MSISLSKKLGRGRALNGKRRRRQAGASLVQALEPRLLLATTLLSTGPVTEDGSLNIAVDAFGAYGTETTSFASDTSGDGAVYNPMDPAVGPLATTASSSLYVKTGTLLEAFLRDGGEGLPDAGFTSTTSTTASSTFTISGLSFQLEQVIGHDPLGRPTLQQTYYITNNTGSQYTLTLLRHTHGALYFDGTAGEDYAGVSSDHKQLFQFDSAQFSAQSSVYYSIATGEDPFEVPAGYTAQQYPYESTIRGSDGIYNGRVTHWNKIYQDTNGDGLSDSGYDATLSQQTSLFIGNGLTGVYRTTTTFGAGIPSQVIYAGTFSIEYPTYELWEDAGSLTVNVLRTGGSCGEATVNFAAYPLTAHETTDFSPTSRELLFADGQTSRTVTIAIVDDLTPESAETFGLNLFGQSSGASLATVHSALVTILDDDGAGTLNFAASQYNVAETGGSITLLINRTNGRYGAITADWSTVDDTAVGGQDFPTGSGTVSFADGQLTASITIDITDDALVEGLERFFVSLSDPGEGVVLGQTSTTSVFIHDDDTGVRFAGPQTSVLEGLGTLLTVQRQGNGRGAISVHWATVDGTAVAGTDYIADSGTLEFGDGEMIKTFSVVSLFRAGPQGTKRFQVVLSDPATGPSVHLGSIPAVDVDVTDYDDVPPSISGTAILSGGGKIWGVRITYNEEMNAESASTASSFSIFRVNRKGDLIPMALQYALYEPETLSTLVVPVKPLPENQLFRLTVSFMGNVRDVTGNTLDGNADSVPGDSYWSYFARGKNIMYYDADGDRVRLRLGGKGAMDLITDAVGQAEQLTVSRTGSGRLVLTGNVGRNRFGGDGLAAIGLIDQVMDSPANFYIRLKQPPFSIGATQIRPF